MTEYLGNGKGADMPLSELRLGDTVELFDGPYGTGIVKQITERDVYFFRPYGQGEHFSYGGSDNGSQIICYTGTETFSRSRSGRETIKVWRRETVR